MDSASGEILRWSGGLAAEQTDRQRLWKLRHGSGILGFVSHVILDLTMSPLQDYPARCSIDVWWFLNPVLVKLPATMTG